MNSQFHLKWSNSSSQRKVPSQGLLISKFPKGLDPYPHFGDFRLRTTELYLIH